MSSTAAPETPLTAHPMLWRGGQLSHQLDTLASGHTGLDAVLPGNGWPKGAVTELIHGTAGCGELSLLLPALARLSQENHWIVMVDPPWIPYPPALRGHGLSLERLLLLRTRDHGESLWACEQVVRGIAGGAVLAWARGLSFGELRRLQLGAQATGKTVFIFHEGKTANQSSPAALRLLLEPDDSDLLVRILKCRGQRPVSPIRIRQPQLLQPLIPPFVSSSGSSKRASSSSESPLDSRATSRTDRPSL